MECQDCGGKEADVLIFSEEKHNFFLVCKDCITDDDYICPDSLLIRWNE